MTLTLQGEQGITTKKNKKRTNQGGAVTECRRVAMEMRVAHHMVGTRAEYMLLWLAGILIDPSAVGLLRLSPVLGTNYLEIEASVPKMGLQPENTKPIPLIWYFYNGFDLSHDTAALLFWKVLLTFCWSFFRATLRTHCRMASIIIFVTIVSCTTHCCAIDTAAAAAVSNGMGYIIPSG